jgi:putative oxidoreductase
MPGLFDAAEPTVTWVDRTKTMVPPTLVGLLFVFIGYTKFDSNGSWVQIFARIGLGDWFRYFTGGMQMLGGLLMCVPKTMVYGAAMLTCTMIGAVFVDLFVIHQPFFIIPFFLGVVIVIVAMLCRESSG